MTEAELISRQALRIAELEESLADRDERLRKIHMTCICIGGPLNDNVLGYNMEQLGPFRRIAEEAETS